MRARTAGVGGEGKWVGSGIAFEVGASSCPYDYPGPRLRARWRHGPTLSLKAEDHELVWKVALQEAMGKAEPRYLDLPARRRHDPGDRFPSLVLVLML